MFRSFSMFAAIGITVAIVASGNGSNADDRMPRAVQEEVWALPLVLPTIAYVVRPVGPGPFPLAVMNHGVSLDSRDRSFFPLVEFRDAAMWFAQRGYMVVAPSGSGYGATALDTPDRGLFSVFYSKIGTCETPNFRDAGLAVVLLVFWFFVFLFVFLFVVFVCFFVFGF